MTTPFDFAPPAHIATLERELARWAEAHQLTIGLIGQDDGADLTARDYCVSRANGDWLQLILWEIHGNGSVSAHIANDDAMLHLDYISADNLRPWLDDALCILEQYAAHGWHAAEHRPHISRPLRATGHTHS